MAKLGREFASQSDISLSERLFLLHFALVLFHGPLSLKLNSGANSFVGGNCGLLDFDNPQVVAYGFCRVRGFRGCRMPPEFWDFWFGEGSIHGEN